jgi:DNA polymerase V
LQRPPFEPYLTLIPARGIAMGQRGHLHGERIAAAGVTARSSNYTPYGRYEPACDGVLSRFTPDIEIYSIDEAFLGLNGSGAHLKGHARALRAAVLQ